MQAANLEKAIERLVQRRKLGDGDKLPTERELAAALGQSRHAVRQALDLLESQGKIWRHVGRGTFVGRPRDPDPRSIAAAASHTSPREIAEARRLLEPQAAAAAARHATEAQVEAIEDANRRCRAARSMDSYEIWDEAFHRAVIAAAGNRMLIALFEIVNRARKEIVWGTMRRAVLHPERREFYCDQHAAVAEAIRARDPAGAGRAMAAHMGTLVGLYGEVEDFRATGRGSIAV